MPASFSWSSSFETLGRSWWTTSTIYLSLVEQGQNNGFEKTPKMPAAATAEKPNRANVEPPEEPSLKTKPNDNQHQHKWGGVGSERAGDAGAATECITDAPSQHHNHHHKKISTQVQFCFESRRLAVTFERFGHPACKSPSGANPIARAEAREKGSASPVTGCSTPSFSPTHKNHTKRHPQRTICFLFRRRFTMNFLVRTTHSLGAIFSSFFFFFFFLFRLPFSSFFFPLSSFRIFFFFWFCARKSGPTPTNHVL
jgi:hypothetical protein